MTALDHLLLFVLLVWLPFQGWADIRGLAAAVRGGDGAARSRTLVGTIALEWLLAAALLAGWRVAGRSWPSLGLTLHGGAPAVLGLAAVGAALLLAWLQYRAVARLAPERTRRLVERTGDSLLLLPRTAGEHRLFSGVSLTAGICEELLYRGFLFWYLGRWLSPWAVVVAAAVPFGVAHFYQGRQGVVRTAVLGAALGALYLVSGSLLWPMAAHAVIDLGAGMLGRAFERAERREPSPAAASR